MDWQSTDLNRSWSYAFLGLVRKSTARQESNEITQSLRNWAKHMRILNSQLDTTGAFAAISLADIPVGLSVNRWFSTAFEHPHSPEVSDDFERLGEALALQLIARMGRHN